MKCEDGHERREVEVIRVFMVCFQLIYLHSLAENEGNLSEDSLVTQPRLEPSTSYIQVYNFTSTATCSNSFARGGRGIFVSRTHARSPTICLNRLIA